jgi:hypothetical protein
MRQIPIAVAVRNVLGWITPTRYYPIQSLPVKVTPSEVVGPNSQFKTLKLTT